MKVRIENFGPIRNADFELGDTTIVIGPNASGKSFISILLYSILSTTISHVSQDFEIKPEASLSYYLDIINDALSKALKGRLEELFGVKFSELISYGSKESRISFTNSIGNLTIIMDEQFKAEITFNRNIKVVTNFIERSDLPSLALEAKPSIDEENGVISVGAYTANERIAKDLVLIDIANAAFSLIFKDFVPAVILPTERNLVLSNLIGYLSMYISSNTPTDKPIIRHFVKSLLYAMQISANKEFSLRIGDSEMEYKIVEPFVLEIYEKDHRIPIPLLSSGYSQIIPIDIMSRMGRFMIIEEPELNLHAGAQVGMANYLGDLIQQGKKLFLTTHSDIFIVQMAINHVKKNKDKSFKIYLLNKGNMEEIEYTEKGDVESIPTITDVIREQIKEIYGE